MSQLVNVDPVTIVQQFYRRVDAMFTILTTKEGGPLGVVEHYFWRMEMQARGAPHIHCKLWIKDAPIVGKNTPEEIMAFIEKYITCQLPNQTTCPQLFELVTRYQLHTRCSKTCLRKKKVVSKQRPTTKDGNEDTSVKIKELIKWISHCRFGFPRHENLLMKLNSVAKLLQNRKLSRNPGQKLYTLIRTELETLVNDYNATLLLMWKGNMDLQYIGEDSMAINYYMTK